MVLRIFLILSIIFLTSCASYTLDSKSKFAPKPFRMGSPDPNAPIEYKHGWEDGCITGLSTMNHGSYKTFYKYRQDPDLADNEMYYKAWKDSYTYCRHYSFRFVWDSIDKVGNKSQNNPLCILCPNEHDR